MSSGAVGATIRLRLVTVAALASLCGCAPGEAEAGSADELEVVGQVQVPLTVEQLGGTALTNMHMMLNPKRAERFFGEWLGKSCSFAARPDLSDAEVLVKDAEGSVVALGHVEAESEIVRAPIADGLVMGVACRWDFEVAGVPVTERVYALSVNGSDDMHFSADELRKPLTLTGMTLTTSY